MFRRLIMVIFRLYMKHLVSSNTKHVCLWATYMGWGGGKVGMRSRICLKGWMEWVAWRGSMLLPSYV